MKGDTLNLQVGTMVQLELDGPEEAPRHMVRVIGYVPGGSLLVGTPVAHGNVQIVREGQKFKVRVLRGDSVVGFTSKVLVSTLKPYPHLHLSYPSELEQIVVRNSARVTTHVACLARNTGQPDAPENFRKAAIIDLSETGAKLASPVPLGEVGEMLQVNFQLRVTGQDEQLSLVADIKNSMERLENDEKGKRLVHVSGVQFRALNRFQQLLLYAWVMGQVAAGANSRMMG
jgi:c-di-GMP-binding flagellar brake protein YcgR